MGNGGKKEIQVQTKSVTSYGLLVPNKYWFVSRYSLCEGVSTRKDSNGLFGTVHDVMTFRVYSQCV